MSSRDFRSRDLPCRATIRLVKLHRNGPNEFRKIESRWKLLREPILLVWCVYRARTCVSTALFRCHRPCTRKVQFFVAFQGVLGFPRRTTVSLTVLRDLRVTGSGDTDIQLPPPRFALYFRTLEVSFSLAKPRHRFYTLRAECARRNLYE